MEEDEEFDKETDESIRVELEIKILEVGIKTYLGKT